MMGFRTRRAVLAALLASAAAVADAHGQAYTLAGGARMFDGDDGESATMGALRTEFPIGSTALIEFASSIAEVPDENRAGVRSVFEAQVQLPVHLGDVLTPYFGAGAGLGHVNHANDEDEGGWQGVLSASAGVRIAFADQLGAVIDARVRGIGLEFTGSHTDLTVGLRYSLVRPDRPRFRGAPK
jgi:opacity protein-like surface antigen